MINNRYMKKKLKELDKVLNNCKTLIIYIHDFPDPDAVASAMILSCLVLKRYNIRSKIVYGGFITRAENISMIQQLHIKMTPINTLQLSKYKHFALVDTQPGFGNNSFSSNKKPLIVIDHHEYNEKYRADFIDIRPEYGATTTILMEYIKAADLDITSRIATAAVQAIRSETQELSRDATESDIKLYLEIYSKANQKKLARISHPKFPKAYFSILHTALEKGKIFRHIVHVHLGKIVTPEFVSLIADIMLQHERVSWTLVTGRYKNNLFISLRCTRKKANAGKMLKNIIGKMGNAGGHDMIAGGKINVDNDHEEDWQKFENIVIDRFVRKIGIKKDIEWRPLLENSI
jgi:nanoRNase/pAp phosphatase (c-di-AMP/oligoRNAs hydrolase)